MSGIVPWRDDADAMEAPMVSLAKGKRTTPIRWKSADGERWVEVTANATYGMATIWDYDVNIWAISQINEALEKKAKTSPTLRLRPHDMLEAIGRDVGGKGYKELEAALDRLKGTTVKTNMRVEGRRKVATFGLLESWEHETDEATGRSIGMQITLPLWLYDGVVKHGKRLAVSPQYFDLSSGIARFLYTQARRHGGKQGAGFRLSMARLHERSGSIQPVREFARAVRKVVKSGIPDYQLSLGKSAGGEFVHMVRDPAKARPQRRDLDRVMTLGIAKDLSTGTGDHPRPEHGGSPAPKHGGSPAKARGITRRN
jgi:plasmid replication initiation protein